MNRLPLSITLSEPGSESAGKLYKFLQENRQHPALIPMLNMDLTFISPHAKTMNDFVIDKVEHLHNNTYSLYYKIHYFIFNLCQDMNIEDIYATSLSFTVDDGYLTFEVIESDRDTVDEF